jgi:hypothetical protein
VATSVTARQSDETRSLIDGFLQTVDGPHDARWGPAGGVSLAAMKKV